MAPRPIKIKRYRNMGDRRHRRPVFGRVLLFLLLGGMIFALGWFGASRCIDAVTGFWYQHFSVHRPDDSAADSQPEDSSLPQESQGDSASAFEEEPPAPPPVVAADAAGCWGELPLSALESEETLRAALDALVARGCNFACLTLKDERGYIYYDSQVELAVSAGAVRATVDVGQFVRLCKTYELHPAVRLQGFCDPLAARADRTAAVQFQRDGVLWLDSSLELGGKPWLNPYSLTARNYLLEISGELAAMGVEDIVFAGIQFPQGYSLEYCYYGEGSDAITRTQCLQECVTLLQSTLEDKDVRCWFEWPTDAALGLADPLVYGDGPAAYSALRIFLVPSVSYTAEGLTVLPEPDAAALNSFFEAATAAGAQRFGLSLSTLVGDVALANRWQDITDFTHILS